MPRSTYAQYLDLRLEERYAPAEARRELHLDFKAAAAYERRLLDAAAARREKGLPVRFIASDREGDETPLPADDLSNEALAALEDFSYFRRRYFGRDRTPWQELAAEQMLELLGTPDKEYVVVNVPPGSGKSTLFTHDIPVWLACRNRALRCMIGSYTERQALQYVNRIRRTLMRRTPMPEAESTLIKDFGGFRPLDKDVWRANEFVIAQFGETEYSEKESSFAAYGYDSGFLGGRFDLIVWDDLVDKHTLRTSNLDELERWYGDEAESRCEPGGLFILQGQRLARHDLYRHALDLKLEDGSPKYRHIVYRAHYEDMCRGEHPPDAPYWPEGCLLDPVRVSWKDQASKMRNAFGRYRTLYQQEDYDDYASLVRQIWLDGGEEDDVTYPGCFDSGRRLGALPPGADVMVPVISVDPSAVNKWGIGLWLCEPWNERRHLVDLHNGPLQVSEFLDYNFATGDFSGLLEDWFRKYLDLGVRVRNIIVEINAAQRWLLQNRHAQQWASIRGVTFIPHTSSIRKTDPDLGIQTIGSLFQHGKVRLPGKGDNEHVKEFILQLLTWPNCKNDDLVMMCWFLELRWADLVLHAERTPSLWTPSWMRNARRGALSA